MLKQNNPLVSIIIRTKNEERWITSCLNNIFRQSYKNFEVILVDSQSTDKTIERAKKFPIKEVHIEEYFPGKAINVGVEEAKGDYIVCISAHCIPVNDHWLYNLVRNLDDKSLAGVYGRQQPLPYSSNLDKRDRTGSSGTTGFFMNFFSIFRIIGVESWRTSPSGHRIKGMI